LKGVNLAPNATTKEDLVNKRKFVSGSLGHVVPWCRCPLIDTFLSFFSGFFDAVNSSGVSSGP